MLEGKAYVKDTDMPLNMQVHAMDSASQALDLYDVVECTTIAAYIKKCSSGTPVTFSREVAGWSLVRDKMSCASQEFYHSGPSSGGFPLELLTGRVTGVICDHGRVWPFANGCTRCRDEHLVPGIRTV
ncbi:putative dynein light chain, type, dynein light chain superfamily protein [Helianthus annuus]|nr:putative dynein light chain, type, dynein light chain superfamily protein [Helianthus annuus]